MEVSQNGWVINFVMMSTILMLAIMMMVIVVVSLSTSIFALNANVLVSSSFNGFNPFQFISDKFSFHNRVHVLS